MCGIAGIVNFDQEVSRERILEMCNTMVHRGPDAEGVFIDGSVGLGHRRLSIIDLSENGNQPMVEDSGNYIIVFNGEIYGFQTLKNELLELGVTFRSKSDTEVVLYGFIKWGAYQLYKKLKGMFAIAIWDKNRQELTLMRDKWGEKPLFYRKNGSSITFASNTHALYYDEYPKLSRIGVYTYFALGFNPPSIPIFEDLEEVKPSSYLVINKEGLNEYIVIEESIPKLELSPEIWLAKLDETIETVVSEELVSDVPIASLLSGGVDSAIISYYASKISKLSLFTVKMSDGIDESEIASRVAKHIGAKHKIVKSDFPKLELVVDFLAHFSQPLGDSSALGMWMVSKSVSSYSKVLLTGDGGDELFAGYDSISFAINLEKYRAIFDNSLGKLTSQVVNRVLQNSKKNLVRKSATFLNLVTQPAWRYHINRNFIPNELRNGFVIGYNAQKDFEKKLSELLDFCGEKTDIESLMKFDQKSILPGDFLPKVDVSSMYNSIECRAPFLHQDVYSIAAQMPMNIKRLGNSSKGILKKLLVSKLGDTAAKDSISGKRGFVVPINSWILENKLAIKEIIYNSKFYLLGMVSIDTIHRVWEGYNTDPYRYGRVFYSLLSISIWSNKHM
jgi:asparagine synthase (glutamine-hydrolysing)